MGIFQKSERKNSQSLNKEAISEGNYTLLAKAKKEKDEANVENSSETENNPNIHQVSRGTPMRNDTSKQFQDYYEVKNQNAKNEDILVNKRQSRAKYFDQMHEQNPESASMKYEKDSSIKLDNAV
jgi:hypothetical protein